jgi:hypothetical protein
MHLFLIKTYYKMFFLITHVLIGKYYPSLVTQFLIGCTCYMLSFLIIKDTIFDSDNFDQYKYYVLTLAAIDVTFIFCKTKSHVNAEKLSNKHVEPKPKIIKKENDPKTNNMYTVTLTSEINDFRIIHDSSLSDSNVKKSMFSTSDENTEDKKVDLKKLSETSTLDKLSEIPN